MQICGTTSKFQSNAELRNGLIKNDDLKQMMEHLYQDSKYGQSFSKLNGNRIRRDLAQIVEELELKESKLRLLKDWNYKTWIKIYSLDPSNFKQLELSTFQVC